MRWSYVASSLVITLTFAGLVHGQETAPDVHPEKAVFKDLPDWPATSPGQVELTSFGPFRAVYDRSYTQGSGPGKGEPRRDRVIVSAEEVGWEGRQAVAITVLDSAAAEHADTNARALLMVVSKEDMSLLFEAGPIPGAAKDYYFVRVEDDEILLSQVMTGDQRLMPKKIPVGAPGFGPGSWVMASMDLKPGAKVRLDPYYSPTANPISQASHGVVLEQREVQDGSGRSHQAWVVETGGWYGPASPKVLRLYLRDRPPYLLGVETYDHDADTGKRFVWLRSFQSFER